MEAPITLSDLGDDILTLIFEQVEKNYSPAIIALTKVSRQCYHIAYPILWHSVTLSELPYMLQRQKKITEVLLDERHSARNFVREIRVEGRSKCDKGFDSKTLEKILDNMKALRSFRWETPHMIAENAISKLENHWPDASLHIVSNNTGSGDIIPFRPSEPTARRDLELVTDRRLLSSPLLYSLEYKICSVSKDGNLFSELNTLCDILARSPKLETLKIGFHGEPHPCDRERFLSSELKEMKIQAQTSQYGPEISLPPDFQLPQLTKLTRPLNERFDVRHLKLLTMLLFSHLSRWKTPMKILKLDQLSPHLPFEQLEGRTPNLRYLEVLLDSSQGLDNYWPALQFVESLNCLQKLHIQNKTTNIGGVWSAVLKHKCSLRSLHVWTDINYTFSGGNGYVRHSHPLLAEQDFATLCSFPLLSEIEVDISLADAEAFIIFGHGKGEIQNLTERGRILTRMGNIEKIKLNVEIPAEECKFTDASVPHKRMLIPLRQSTTRAAVIGLFDQILVQNPNCNTQTVEMFFRVCGYDECVYQNTIFCASVQVEKMKDEFRNRTIEDPERGFVIGVASGIELSTYDSGPYCTWKMCD